MPNKIKSHPSKEQVRSINESRVDESIPSSSTLSDENAIKGRAYYRERIQLHWNKAFKSILAITHLIADARFHLPRLEWNEFRDKDCPFDDSTLQKFIRMSESDLLNEPANEYVMPNSIYGAYEITLMDDATFRAGVDQKIIHSGSTVKELKDFRVKMQGPSRKPISRRSNGHANSHANSHATDGCAPPPALSSPFSLQSTSSVVGSPASDEEESLASPDVQQEKVNRIIVTLTRLDIKDLQLAGELTKGELTNRIRPLCDDLAFVVGVALIARDLEVQEIEVSDDAEVWLEEHSRSAEPRA